MFRRISGALRCAPVLSLTSLCSAASSCCAMATPDPTPSTLVVRLPQADRDGDARGARLNDIARGLIRDHAAPLLARGELVAFPTETVYGLGANALSAHAVQGIFRCKGRPSDNPLIVHVSDWDMLRRVVREDSLPQEGSMVHGLCKRFWPGPLTVLFPKHENVPGVVTANRPRVAVRMPSHPVALELIQAANVPVAAPSANRSGRPSPTVALHVLVDLARATCVEVGTNENSGATGSGELGERKAEDGVACVVDGGSCSVGVESTVIDASQDGRIVILRPGGVTAEQLQEACPDAVVEVIHPPVPAKGSDQRLSAAAQSAIDCPETPGLKYRHYSPSARVVLLEHGPSDVVEQLLARSVSQYAADVRVGVIHSQGGVALPSTREWHTIAASEDIGSIGSDAKDVGSIVIDVSCDGTGEQLAHTLFAAFRSLDEWGAAVIVVEGVPEHGIGLAIMNRARKAADEVIHSNR